MTSSDEEWEEGEGESEEESRVEETEERKRPKQRTTAADRIRPGPPPVPTKPATVPECINVYDGMQHKLAALIPLKIKGKEADEEKQSDHYRMLKQGCRDAYAEIAKAGAKMLEYEKAMAKHEAYQREEMKIAEREQKEYRKRKGPINPRRKKRDVDASIKPRKDNKWWRVNRPALKGKGEMWGKAHKGAYMWGGLFAIKSARAGKGIVKSNKEPARCGMTGSGQTKDKCYTGGDEWGNMWRIKVSSENEDEWYLEVGHGSQCPDTKSVKSAYQMINVAGDGAPDPHPFPGGPYVALPIRQACK